MTQRDQVYQRRHDQIVDFAFDDAVADVFPDMIRRSVPGYETVIPMTGLLAARELARSGTTPRRAYDLGCSLGATALAMLRQLDEPDAEVVAVDNAPAMIRRAAELVKDPRLTFRCADIRELALEPARAVTLNYVLQFLPPEHRLNLLKDIRRCLAPDGVLLISEKIRFDDAATQQAFEAAHLAYKRANGYSELEISQKRTALEHVMIVDTEAMHRQRFREAGFSAVRRWYQCLNWASFEVRP